MNTKELDSTQRKGRQSGLSHKHSVRKMEGVISSHSTKWGRTSVMAAEGDDVADAHSKRDVYGFKTGDGYDVLPTPLRPTVVRRGEGGRRNGGIDLEEHVNMLWSATEGGTAMLKGVDEDLEGVSFSTRNTYMERKPPPSVGMF